MDKARAFIDHVYWLFGDSADRFMMWLAHIEQEPGILPHHGWLHISPTPGTGRNWLSSVLTRVWAGQVAASVNLHRLLTGDFNGPLAHKVLAISDEIRVAQKGSGRWIHKEKLDEMITCEYRQVNPKFGKERTGVQRLPVPGLLELA